MSIEDDGPRSPDRLAAFTDGVVVVAMTLLVLNIELPDSDDGLEGAALLAEILKLWPNYLGYALSFVVIGQYWMGYTATFGRMKRVDEGFTWLNLLFMLLIGFVPFVTALLSDHYGAIPVMFYSAIMIAISAMLVIMLRHSHRRGLLVPQLSGVDVWYASVPWLKVIAVFGLSMAVAPALQENAKFAWLLLFLPDWPKKPASGA